MRKAVEDNCHANLRKILDESSFIGNVSKEQFIMQSGTVMYLCNGANLR